MRKININRTVYIGIVIMLAAFFTIAVSSQLILLIPSVGGSLPVSGTLQYEKVESFTGQVIVELKDGYKPDDNIKILVNGSEAASLSVNRVNLNVMNNSVIEIDGRRVNYPFEVTITPVDNKSICKGDSAYVEGNVVRLSRVIMNVDNDSK